MAKTKAKMTKAEARAWAALAIAARRVQSLTEQPPPPRGKARPTKAVKATGSRSAKTGSNTRLRARTGTLPLSDEKAAAVLDHRLSAVSVRRSVGGGR